MKLSGTGTVKPISGSPILGVGTHPVTVIEEEELENTDERRRFKLTMESIGGDEPGGRISAWWTITSKSMPFILGQIEAFGVELPEGEFDWISLVGRNCKITVRKEPSKTDPEKIYSEVKAYAPLTDDDLAVASVQQDFGAGVVEDDEDIPF